MIPSKGIWKFTAAIFGYGKKLGAILIFPGDYGYQMGSNAIQYKWKLAPCDSESSQCCHSNTVREHAIEQILNSRIDRRHVRPQSTQSACRAHSTNHHPFFGVRQGGGCSIWQGRAWPRKKLPWKSSLRMASHCTPRKYLFQQNSHRVTWAPTGSILLLTPGNYVVW